MLNHLRTPIWRAFLGIEGATDRIVGPSWNPFYHLGALGYFFYWIVAATGIFLFVFFDTSAVSAFVAVEYLTHTQWYLGGVMRSLHRYGSDAMVVVMMVHMTREFAKGRYTGARWFAWFTGIPLVWFVLTSGVTGYWLVWDQLAQYLAIGSMEWLDWLGIFSEPIANNFLTRGSITDRFFTLLIFMHIFVPLMLLFFMWVHLLRISNAETNPPKGLAIGSLGMLLVLSLIKPAVSHPMADLGMVARELHMDWFYLAFYPLFDKWGAGALWALGVGGSLLLSLVPLTKRPPAPTKAVVDPPNCNGCSRCFVDCPFGAITMQPRTDGRNFPKIASVDTSLCTGCGICFGSCPTGTPFRTNDFPEAGIYLPDYPMIVVRKILDDAIASLTEEPRVLVFGCERSASLAPLAGSGVAPLTLPCIGMVSPPFVDYALSRGGVDGVVLTGCREGDCFHRLGIMWTEQRVARERAPELRERVSRDRILLSWAGAPDSDRLRAEVTEFRESLRHLPTLSQTSGGDVP